MVGRKLEFNPYDFLKSFLTWMLETTNREYIAKPNL